MKKVLTLILALGLVVAFTSAAVAMGICGGPKVTQAQAKAEPAATPADQIVVAQAEMTEDTSPVTSDGEGEEEDTDSSN